MILVRLAALFVASALAAGVLAVAWNEPARMDFVAQYAAGRIVLEGHARDLVDPAAVLAAERAAAPERVTLLPFVQVPAAALLIAPVSALPLPVAFALSAAVDVLLIAASVLLLRSPGGPLPQLVLLFALPSAVAVAQAQLSPLILLLVAIASRAGPRVGGAALGLTVLRPQTAPLLLLTALLDPRRRWPAVTTALAVVAASAALVGVDGLATYAGQLLDASRWSLTGELGLGGSIGWSAPALALGAPGLGVALAVLSLAGGAAAIARAPREARVATASLWALLASPHVLIHDAVLAYPAVLALAARRPWDAASVAAWTAHVVVAPLGVAWSLALAAAGWRASAARADGPERVASSLA